MKFLYIGLGGFLGAVLRYLLSGWFLRFGTTFPLGTLVVNILGALLLGFLMALVTGTLYLGPEVRFFLAIGFLGSFTTFSTLAYETDGLLKEGQWLLAGLNGFGSVILGIIGVRIGEAVARVLIK